MSLFTATLESPGFGVSSCRYSLCTLLKLMEEATVENVSSFYWVCCFILYSWVDVSIRVWMVDATCLVPFGTLAIDSRFSCITSSVNLRFSSLNFLMFLSGFSFLSFFLSFCLLSSVFLRSLWGS